MTVDPAGAMPPVTLESSGPRNGLVALLVFDGFLCAILSVMFLGLHIGAVQFPITILLAAVVNLLLVIAVRTETERFGLAMLPLGAWLVGFVACLAGGPGGDGLAMADWRILLLPIAALAPAAAYVFAARLKSLTAAARQPAPPQ